MNLNAEYIRQLIIDAHELLKQDNINELSRNALKKCLESVRESEHLSPQEVTQIDNLIAS